MSRSAVFAGSFDPPTYGHLDIIERAAALFDKLYVVVGENPTKNHMFSDEERVGMMKDLLASFPNVEVALWGGLTVDFAKKHGADVLVRGVRSVSDFEFEFETSQINKGIDPQIESVFIPARTDLLLVRSSTVKEMAAFGADISAMLPASVAEAVIGKVRQLT